MAHYLLSLIAFAVSLRLHCTTLNFRSMQCLRSYSCWEFCCSRRGTTRIRLDRVRNRTGCGEFIARQLKMRSAPMLSLVIALLLIALSAGIWGFGGIAGAAVGFAKIVFFVALVLFVISLLTHGLRGGFGRRF